MQENQKEILIYQYQSLNLKIQVVVIQEDDIHCIVFELNIDLYLEKDFEYFDYNLNLYFYFDDLMDNNYFVFYKLEKDNYFDLLVLKIDLEFGYQWKQDALWVFEVVLNLDLNSNFVESQYQGRGVDFENQDYLQVGIIYCSLLQNEVEILFF